MRPRNPNDPTRSGGARSGATDDGGTTDGGSRHRGRTRSALPAAPIGCAVASRIVHW